MHHLFGAEVSEMLKAAYGDAFLTAHFEVCIPADCDLHRSPPP